MNPNKDRILITGGSGLVGTTLTNKLNKEGYELLSINSSIDLRDHHKCIDVFEQFKPTVVFHLAAKVGGILANSSFKSDFYYDNIMINTNVVNACCKSNTRFIFAMGTGCAYPKKLENQILYEKDYLDGIPESTNDAYAYAKRGLLVHLKALKENYGIKYNFALPANLYGPFDNFHLTNSHVIPGLIRRFCEYIKFNKKNIKIWGDGTPKRDFLFIDDCIDAIYKLSSNEIEGEFNLSGKNSTAISELVETIKDVTGFEGEINYDTQLPNGQMQRIMSCEKMDKIGWEPKVSLTEGIKITVKWFLDNYEKVRK